MTERPAKPLLIGLTGSVGMGKSETAKMFAGLGLPVYDADAAVRDLYAKGGAAVGAIGRAFPGAVKNQAVDRQALSRIIASENSALERLEEIVHPLVREKRRAFLEKATTERVPMAVLDIPLLFETGSENDVDVVVVVSAPEDVQRARVFERPGMTEKKFAAISARQIPDSEKRAKADFVIDTGKGLAHAAAQVEAIVNVIQKRRGS